MVAMALVGIGSRTLPGVVPETTKGESVMENVQRHEERKEDNHDMSSKAKIHVFVNRRKLEVDHAELTGEQLLRLGGFAGNEWDLLRLQGEGDPTGGEVILFNQTITVKNGDHFRVIPGNRTFGS